MTTVTTAPARVRRHQPGWDTPELLGAVLGELRSRPPLVERASCLALRDELRSVSLGQAFLLQAGDCAELFAECTSDRVLAKAALLHDLADGFESAAGTPVVRVGRLAGQYAKPRSCATEELADGTVLPTYRGDAVNAAEATTAGRRPDPRRLLRAYDAAAEALSALSVDRLLLTPGAFGGSGGVAPTYVSHEALLLDYEEALTHCAGDQDSAYDSSAHLLWIGDRTRQLDGDHLQFAAEVDNPVAVKVGPTARPAEVREIVERLTDGHPRGRLTLITRMGADRAAGHLPDVVDAVRQVTDGVIWSCDPMHGNTVAAPSGHKTRIVGDVIREIEQSVAVLRDRGTRLGGLHLETTPDAVTECVDSAADLAHGTSFPHYETACDPRLSPRQAQLVVRRTAELLAADRRHDEGGRDS